MIKSTCHTFIRTEVYIHSPRNASKWFDTTSYLHGYKIILPLQNIHTGPYTNANIKNKGIVYKQTNILKHKH